MPSGASRWTVSDLMNARRGGAATAASVCAAHRRAGHRADETRAGPRTRVRCRKQQFPVNRGRERDLQSDRVRSPGRGGPRRRLFGCLVGRSVVVWWLPCGHVTPAGPQRLSGRGGLLGRTAGRSPGRSQVFQGSPLQARSSHVLPRPGTGRGVGCQRITTRARRG